MKIFKQGNRMWICTISLMPDMFEALQHGVVGRAISDKHIDVTHLQLRDFSTLPHQQVDDSSYGGGPGMVLMADPLYQAITHAKQMAPTKARVIYLSPQGQLWNQHEARIIAQNHTQTSLIFIAGRYEGIDQRIIDHHIDEEYSIGDYVLSGGEIAAMTMIDSITRLLPNVLGNELSAENDSFTHEDLLDHPHYTKPAVWMNHHVPDVLLSGNHQKINAWRLEKRNLKTAQRRKTVANQKQTLKQTA